MYCLQWQTVSLVATLRDRSFFIASHPQLQSSFENNYLCSSKGGVIYHGRISASATWESARRTGSRLVKQFGGQLNTVISLWRQCFGHRPWPRGGRARLAFPWVLAAGVHWLHELRELELELCGETFAAPGRLRGCTTDAASRSRRHVVPVLGTVPPLPSGVLALLPSLRTASRKPSRPSEPCRPAAL